MNWKRYLPLAVLLVMVAAGLLIFDERPAPLTGKSETITGEGSAAGGLGPIQAGEITPASGTPAEMSPAALPDEDLFGTDMIWMLLQFILIFGGVCGLAWLSLRWLLPRIYGTQASKSDQIRLVDTYRFDARRSLLLVEVHGKEYLLAGSEQGIQLIARLDDHDPAAGDEHAGPRGLDTSTFEAVLRKGK
ncbi:MAG: flagellar biosynthetic protein FliO [Acidobacteria bacterium]|nr:flagellar biosynthetic protein FliO [Acidobacteriota bacterium]